MENGINHSMGPPHSPQLNGMAERFNRTLLDCILPFLFHARLPNQFWEDVAWHALFFINLSPTRENKGKVCPGALWTNKPSLYCRLRVFGCKAFWLVTGPARSNKLLEKAVECWHLYTLPNGNGWIVWDVSEKHAVKSHYVIFHEDLFRGLGELSKTTVDYWSDWSTKTSTSLPSGDPYKVISLYECRLLTSIHNRDNPVNTQANRIPLPDQTEDKVSDINDQDAGSPSDPDQNRQNQLLRRGQHRVCCRLLRHPLLPPCGEATEISTRQSATVFTQPWPCHKIYTHMMYRF